MLTKWSNYLINHNIIKPEDAEIQQYGLFIILENITFHLAQLLVAILLGLVPESLLFDAVFLTLRHHAGGYHASTPVRCFFMSIVVWVGLMSGSYYIPTLACVILGAVSLVLIWLLGPIPHKNNPLSAERFMRVKKTMRLLLVLFCAVSAVLFALNWAVGGRIVLLVLFCTALSLIGAKTSEAYQHM